MTNPNGPFNLRPFKARAGVDRTDRLWSDFVDRYELFTAVLCSAARDGCDTVKENEYSELRFWFGANYHRVSGCLKPYLDARLAAESGADLKAELPARLGRDATATEFLQVLLRAKSLSELLRNDTGALIPLVALISEAVYLCDSERAGHAEN